MVSVIVIQYIGGYNYILSLSHLCSPAGPRIGHSCTKPVGSILRQVILTWSKALYNKPLD